MSKIGASFLKIDDSTIKGNGSDQIYAVTTTGNLNTTVPYGQIWLPAAAFTTGANPGSLQSFRIASREQSVTAWKCLNGAQSEMFAIVSLQALPIKWSAPLFKIYPVWMQISDTTAPSPTKYVGWSAAICAVLMGNSLDKNNNTYEYKILSPALDKWKIAGGDASSIQRAIAITALNGDTPANTNRNTLLIEVERESGGGFTDDTYANPAYLLGIGIQYATEFSNIAVWPTA